MIPSPSASGDYRGNVFWFCFVLFWVLVGAKLMRGSIGWGWIFSPGWVEGLMAQEAYPLCLFWQHVVLFPRFFQSLTEHSHPYVVSDLSVLSDYSVWEGPLFLCAYHCQHTSRRPQFYNPIWHDRNSPQYLVPDSVGTHSWGMHGTGFSISLSQKRGPHNHPICCLGKLQMWA